MEIQRIDDVGIAVRSIEAALILHQDILGGQFVLGTDDDTLGVRSLLLSYPSGIKIEPLQSTRPESFPERYLQKRNPRDHK